MSDNEGTSSYCYSCGEKVPETRPFCPNCRAEQHIGQSGSEPSYSPFSRDELVLIVSSSLFVFFSAFLPWAQSALQLAAVTGLRTDIGYLTILLALVSTALPYSDTGGSRLPFIISLLGILILLLALWFLSRLLNLESVGIGGGLVLTLIGGLGITFAGIRNRVK